MCIALALVPVRAGVARAASAGELRQQIASGQGRISNLVGAVRSASGRIGQLDSAINLLQTRITRYQAALTSDSAELLRLRNEESAAQIRLKHLEAYQAYAEGVLAKQLVAGYESSPPDIITVVLDSSGFRDLLERLAFMQRIQKQNVDVVSRVKAARRAVATQATRLGAMQVHQQALTQQVLQQRDALAQSKLNLDRQQIALLRYRASKTGQLSGARGRVATLQNQLSGILAAQAAAAAAAAARARQAARAPAGAPAPSSPAGGSPAATPAPVSGAGGFVFPLPKSAAAPPSAWSPDDGVDISAPGDTPEYAVCSGTIVLHGIGGFGPWAPVLHCDSSIDGYSYVYYGHAGPAYQLPVGTHVGAGQVMSSIGPGIVGISTGPHLEIGFADSSGGPIGPSSAGTMLSLLQSSY